MIQYTRDVIPDKMWTTSRTTQPQPSGRWYLVVSSCLCLVSVMQLSIKDLDIYRNHVAITICKAK